jgi:co-chaperonin GroES (HSP10)
MAMRDDWQLILTKSVLDMKMPKGLMTSDLRGVTSKLVDDSGDFYPFEALASHGKKPEGTAPLYYSSPGAAIKSYLQVLEKYLDIYHVGKASLYWREFPRLECDQLEHEGTVWWVYSRLLLGPLNLKNPEPPTMESISDNPKYLEPGWRAPLKGPNPENKSGFRATGHRILCEPEVTEEVSQGGIVLPKKTVDAEKQRAVVVRILEIGPDAWADKSTDYCKVGDRVLIGMYVGKFHISPVDGKEYRFIADLDVISPIEETK